MISIICPMYNEEQEIESNLLNMLKYLSMHFEEWELIIVNDGSSDSSYKIVKSYLKDNKNLRLVSYKTNKGRGYALRMGFKQSRGDIIVTTESDGSWGVNIISEMVDEFKDENVDMVIASPHLPKGGYVNVPFHRRFLSVYGNKILQFSFSEKITMATGMTRAYRRWVIDSLELESNKKEIHLEILSKALLIDARIREIPATLTWSSNRYFSQPPLPIFNVKLIKIIFSHLFFGFKEIVIFIFILLGMLLLSCGLIGMVTIVLSNGVKSLLNSTNFLILVIQGLQIAMFSLLAYQNKKTRIDMIKMNKNIMTILREKEIRNDK